ncbi:MAG: phosphodiester glycosidase family protein [Deltaproteobacteria bacterium]|nr:phosphodiester glycosidase family protein [Deltaproteobacteria bacterium]
MLLIPLIFILLAPDPSPPSEQPVRLKSNPNLSVAEMGQWRPLQKGVEFRKLTLERGEPYQLIDLKMLRFDTRWVVPRIVPTLTYNLKAADVKTLAEMSGAVAVINASYFDEKRKPLGFLKVAADEINPRVSRSSLFTGIFGIKDRLPFITHRDQFLSQQADEGLQAGPLLLLQGAPLTINRGAGKQSRRSLIGLDKDQRLIVAVTDSLLGGLNWAELQEIFASDALQVRATDLLNLDGGGSAQLYVKILQLEQYVAGTAEVPVAVGFFIRQ